MGLFSFFKKDKKKKINDKDTAKTVQPKADENEINASGWDAITDAFEKIYPNQKSPNHYGTIVKWRFGGDDPLDGISIYDAGDCWHFVTYGMTELYEKESDDKAVSGYGMEFTLRLKKNVYEDDEAEVRCICGILQTIARITFNSGELFRPYEYIYTGQTEGIDSKKRSDITGFITVPDRVVSSMSTPNGSVDFVELIGVTDAELQALRSKKTDVRKLYARLGSDVTDYSRRSCL